MLMNVLIFAAGLAVYAGFGMAGFAYLLAAVLISYGAGLLIPRCRQVLWVSILIHAGALALVKLQPLTGMELPAVLGISYFTLKIISYHVDIYREKYPPEKNLFRYGFYVTYLPQIYLGPIERYDIFRSNAFEKRKITWDGISSGALRALWGLFKKLTIAARAGVIVSAIAASPEKYRGAFALLAMVLYSVQLYADFSGGIDIVIGVSRMLGIGVSENFNVPYASESFQEFWRRWHMTLGSWLREYVYIPLGGNRKGKFRKWVNTIVTFLVSGLWHGGAYILWGLFNGIFVSLGEKCKTPWKWLNRLVTFLLVSVLWAFFVWPDGITALRMMGSLVTTFNYGDLIGQIGQLGLNRGEWIVFLGATAGLCLWDFNFKSMGEKLKDFSPAARLALMGGLGLVILIFGMYGIGFDAQAFIYSKF